MFLNIPLMHGYGTFYEKTSFLYLNGQSRKADERLSSDFGIGRVTKNISLYIKKNSMLQSSSDRDGVLLEDQLRNLSKIMKF
jgi:hypothetical protein